MKIELKKFGTLLHTREAGRADLVTFQPTLAELPAGENLEVDFDGVITFSPSWGDEFLTPLHNQLGERFILLPTDNPSVKATIELLEKISGKNFEIK